jgi:anthranilate phosphoribosyltransferase
MQMHEIIAIVGKGKKLSRDLSKDEAQHAMRLLMDGKASPYQVGAFLIALRVKGETAEELAAFAEVVQEYNKAIKTEKPDYMVDIPLYSGRRKSFHSTFASALIMASAGVHVVMHGHSAIPLRRGIGEVLEAAGVNINLEADQAGERLRKQGFCYIELSRVNSVMTFLLGLRKEFGVRTVINTLLRVYNPSQAKCHLIGVTHTPYLERLAQTLMTMKSERALIFKGVEGESEIPLRSIVAITEVINGSIQRLHFPIGSLNLTAQGGHILRGGTALDEVKLTSQILTGEVRGSHRDSALLNAGFGIYVSGKALSPAEGIEMADEVLDSGNPAEKFFELTKSSPKGRRIVVES